MLVMSNVAAKADVLPKMTCTLPALFVVPGCETIKSASPSPLTSPPASPRPSWSFVATPEIEKPFVPSRVDKFKGEAKPLDVPKTTYAFPASVSPLKSASRAPIAMSSNPSPLMSPITVSLRPEFSLAISP